MGGRERRAEEGKGRKRGRTEGEGRRKVGCPTKILNCLHVETVRKITVSVIMGRVQFRGPHERKWRRNILFSLGTGKPLPRPLPFNLAVYSG